MEKTLQLIRASSCIASEDFWKKIKKNIYLNTNKKGIRQIITLPRKIQDSLLPHYENNASNTINPTEICTAFGMIGWSSWTTIDAVLDKEYFRNDDILIFSATRSIMEDLMAQLSLTRIEQAKISGAMSMMEYANSTLCKLKLETQLILKSIGVSLPSIALLIKLGVEKRNISLCHRYFYHFIGARQLSDDALDWPEDMKKGHRTLVTQWLEEEVGKDKSLREYRKAFDTKVSPKTSRAILRHARKSIAYAKKMTCFTSTEFLEELPRFYEDMATKILLS